MLPRPWRLHSLEEPRRQCEARYWTCGLRLEQGPYVSAGRALALHLPRCTSPADCSTMGECLAPLPVSRERPRA